MFSKFIQILKIPELRAKVIFVLAMLAVFRLLAVIPIPGVDLLKIKAFFAGSQFFGLLNIFSGGALSNFSIAMLGVGPYITATIIMQLLTMIFPGIKALYYEEGEAGKAKFNQYSRLFTVPLAMVQSYGFLSLLRNQGVVTAMTPFELFRNVIVITTGSLFLMWLGELITEKKIGNGVSLIIFAGIVADAPNILRQNIATYDPSKIPSYLILLIVSLVVIAGVVLINEAERKIPVNYAKRVRGSRMYGGVSTYLPLKVNQAGVIPIIFALSLLLFPNMIAQVLSASKNPMFLKAALWLQSVFNNQVTYGVLYFVLVVVFTFFYTVVTFEPHEISNNLQKQGGFIPGVRPGSATAEFLSRILNRVTLTGAIFLGLIAVLPSIVQGITHINTLRIGGTSLLIVVSVALETMRQIEAQLVMREYEGF
ncbi:MAG: preprotein translocase subunit SecY [Parcubacteria group bacterium]|nr:preprotein translocase subunit SecY [Parcubacteria group bacterium]